MAETLRVAERGDAILVGLDRPAKRNALDTGTIDAFHAVLDTYRRRPGILVVHSTTPGMFASGGDVAQLLERDADDALLGIMTSLTDRLEAHRWPTIAVVDGPALGGGCELALACDLRLVTPRARFGQPELSLGILAGAGANWRLPQLVGLGLARRMLYTGENLRGAAAVDAGLADAIHPPDKVLDAAVELAGEIATRPWRALELTKLALQVHRPATTTFDVAAQALLFGTDEKRERMQRFLRRHAERTPDRHAEPAIGDRDNGDRG